MHMSPYLFPFASPSQMISLSKETEEVNIVVQITKFIPSFPLQDDIMGKKLLSLLPAKEKNEVYQKIALKVPLPNSGTDCLFQIVSS